MLGDRELLLRENNVYTKQWNRININHQDKCKCDNNNCLFHAKFSYSKAYIEICDECNLSCPYCMIDSVPFPKGIQIPLAIVRYELCDLIHFLGVKQCWLSGGEPTLHTHFSEITWALSRIVGQLTIITNGILLDQDNILEAISTSHSGCQISLPSVHNRELIDLHGNIANRILSNAMNLRSRLKDNRLIAHFILSRANTSFIADQIQFAKDYGYDEVIFTFVKPNGRAKEHPYLRLSLKDRVRILHQIKELKNKYMINIILSGGLWDKQDNLPEAIVQKIQARACVDFSEEIEIRPDGAIIPCAKMHPRVRNSSGWPTIQEYLQCMLNSCTFLSFPKSLIDCPIASRC